jgi:hypothetical protein
LASFYRCLYDCKLRGEGIDKLCWVPSHKGLFEVKSFYRALSPRGSYSFPWKSVWRSKVPPTMAFFVWTAVHSKILTLDNFGRKGLVVVNRCWLCEMERESVDHLLLHCVVVRGLWNTFFARFGLCWVSLAPSRSYLQVGGRGVVRGALMFGRWSLIVLCGVFGGSKIIDVSRTREELLHFFPDTLFTWTTDWLAPPVISFVDFLSFFSISP